MDIQDVVNKIQKDLNSFISIYNDKKKKFVDGIEKYGLTSVLGKQEDLIFCQYRMQVATQALQALSFHINCTHEEGKLKRQLRQLVKELRIDANSTATGYINDSLFRMFDCQIKTHALLTMARHLEGYLGLFQKDVVEE